MAEVLFFIAAAGALAGAFGVINPLQGNPFYSVLALVVHLISLAALFLLLRSEFIAAAQVVVYAGAVMVLYVFVVAYIGGEDPPQTPLAPNLRGVSFLFVGLLLVELCIAFLGTGLKALESEGAGYEPGFGTPEQLGELLLTKFLLPFELASILLTIAAVGAVVLARRRGGIHPEDDQPVYTAAEFFLPKGTGTMREGVSGIPDVGGEPAGSHPKGTVRPEIAAGRGGREEPEGGW
jgi:NADH:ubiquinone oxidoreductase subunit 6 (subunit J)